MYLYIYVNALCIIQLPQILVQCGLPNSIRMARNAFTKNGGFCLTKKEVIELALSIFCFVSKRDHDFSDGRVLVRLVECVCVSYHILLILAKNEF